jgi:hypothetical protein
LSSFFSSLWPWSFTWEWSRSGTRMVKRVYHPYLVSLEVVPSLSLKSNPTPSPLLLPLRLHSTHRAGRVLRFFSSRWNWDSPNPSPAHECAPHPVVPGGGAHAGDRGDGRVPITTRGHTLWYSLYVSALCFYPSNSAPLRIYPS